MAFFMNRSMRAQRTWTSRLVAQRPPGISSSRITRAGRCYSSESTSAVEPPDYLDESERRIFETLKSELQPTKLEVQDVSGGCGSMYALDIVSERFRGLPVIKQHRLVNTVLGEDIKRWHGVQLKTRVP
ncbi:hypothetical protein LTR53_008905 [Teratosphaeriaceae sp. CCFEE 6253]|nr:hypothetical protein LTR53_008905 [Teratosphaeriaceae sp. CCFEE 6253]